MNVASVSVGMEFKEEKRSRRICQGAMARRTGLILIDKARVHDNTMPLSLQGKINKPKISQSRNHDCGLGVRE